MATTEKKWVANWALKDHPTGSIAQAKNFNKELAKAEAIAMLNEYIIQCRSNGSKITQRHFQLKVYKEDDNVS